MAPFIGHQKHAVRCGAQSGVIFSLIEKSRLIVRRLRSQRHRNRTSGLIHSPPELRDESGEQIPVRGYNILEIHVYTGKLFLHYSIQKILNQIFSGRRIVKQRRNQQIVKPAFRIKRRQCQDRPDTSVQSPLNHSGVIYLRSHQRTVGPESVRKYID